MRRQILADIRYLLPRAALIVLAVALFMVVLGLVSTSTPAHPAPLPTPAYDPRCPSHYTLYGVCTNALTPGYTPGTPSPYVP